MIFHRMKSCIQQTAAQGLAFWRQTAGSAMTEMLLVAPALVAVFGITLHLATSYYLAAQLEAAVRVGTRQLALSRGDNETNGTLTACSALTGTGADGLTSAEQHVCNALAHLSGSFEVYATDGNAAGYATLGDPVTVHVRTDASGVLSFIPGVAGIGPQIYSATLTMRAQEPVN